MLSLGSVRLLQGLFDLLRQGHLHFDKLDLGNKPQGQQALKPVPVKQPMI